MNMKTIAVLVLMGLGLAAQAEDTTQNSGNYSNRRQQRDLGFTISKECKTKTLVNADPSSLNPEQRKCEGLRIISEKFVKKGWGEGTVERQASIDGAIQCVMSESFVADYEACNSAITSYNFVLNAESALNLTQQARTMGKNKNLEEEANKRAAQGDLQAAAFDTSIESNKHQKQLQAEKAAAYGMAVAALVTAYNKIPGRKDIENQCGVQCNDALNIYEKVILSNQGAKAMLQQAIISFTAKGLAAGIAMNQYDTKARSIAAVKKQVAPETEDLMMERCMFNPTDPACATSRTPVEGKSYQGADFNFGSGGSNSFDLGTDPLDPVVTAPDAAPVGDGETVAGISSPFVDEAKAANDILNPAAAASMQAGGGPAAGGGGGGGMGGGGGASLGGDLEGVDKKGESEATVKTNKVSGNYASNGGGGFSAIKTGKDDKNPFASLFDSKSNGGVEEDRSIASGDIDGAASGLFQKISKRYSQIHADKRIEATNLE
jgi:hypothetical protein